LTVRYIDGSSSRKAVSSISISPLPGSYPTKTTLIARSCSIVRKPPGSNVVRLGGDGLPAETTVTGRAIARIINTLRDVKSLPFIFFSSDANGLTIRFKDL
jgi:hypothetical protein